MIDVKEIEKKLKAPFPASEIKWRAQQIRKKFKKDEKEKDKYEAIMLAYIDARAVMDRLDEAVGPNNWRTFYTETDKGRVLCELSINYNGEWVTKTDGAGDTGTEGEKGAISDALKRAAVNHGINRLMYNFGDTRIELEAKDITTNRQGKPTHKWGAKKLSEKCRLPDWYLALLKEKPLEKITKKEDVKQYSEEEVQDKWDKMLASLEETFAHDKEDYKSRYNTIQRTLEKMIQGGDPEFKRRLAYIKQINDCIKKYKQENK